MHPLCRGGVGRRRLCWLPPGVGRRPVRSGLGRSVVRSAAKHLDVLAEVPPVTNDRSSLPDVVPGDPAQARPASAEALPADVDLASYAEGPRHECGVFGVYAPEEDVATLTYF